MTLAKGNQGAGNTGHAGAGARAFPGSDGRKFCRPAFHAAMAAMHDHPMLATRSWLLLEMIDRRYAVSIPLESPAYANRGTSYKMASIMG